MKITIVCGFFLPVPPVAGGAVEKIWWRLARIYAARGHSVTLISRRWDGFPDAETVEGVRLLRVSGWNHCPRLWQNLLLDARWALRVLLALPAADILITNTVTLPVFVHHLCPTAGLLVVNLNRFPKGQVRWYKHASRLQAASRAIAEAATRQAPALADRVLVVPNPVDCHAFTGLPPSRPPTAPLRIGFIGRITAEKGLNTLVAAARYLARQVDLPPWQLILLGPADVPRGGGGEAFLSQLRQTAPELWLTDRIILKPPLFESAPLAQAYLSLDVFCYPTEAATGEAHPVAVLEAMASGLPIVATNLACFADQLQTETNSLLVPPADPAALAAALARLLRDDSLRSRLGTSARVTIWALDDQAIATQHLTDFATLLHNSRR